MIGTKEHYDLLDMFDKMNKHERLDKEDKELWSKGTIYQDGRVNNLYRSFISGYNFAKHLFNDEKIEIKSVKKYKVLTTYSRTLLMVITDFTVRVVLVDFKPNEIIFCDSKNNTLSHLGNKYKYQDADDINMTWEIESGFVEKIKTLEEVKTDEKIEIKDNNVLDEIRDILIEIRNLIKKRR